MRRASWRVVYRKIKTEKCLSLYYVGVYCPERDRLFDEYYRSVSAFSEAVHAMRNPTLDRVSVKEIVRETQAACESALQRLEQHEREHG